MASSRVDQQGASADGDIIGRDKITTIHEAPQPTALTSILREFERQHAADEQFGQIIDELKHFTSVVDGPQSPGLQPKLLAGGREDLVSVATREKELFAKRLAEDQLYRAAQDFYAYMLALVRDRFRKGVSPLITAGASNTDINAAIVTEVVEPCLDELQHNPLRLSALHLQGMIYFLTGNCYLHWTAE